MNLPSANRLWSETSEITSVFRRGYLMTDSHGVMQWPTECLKFCWGHSNKGSLNKQVLLLYVAKLGGSTSPHVPVRSGIPECS